MSNYCEDCNYYTEEFDDEIYDLTPFCVKHKVRISDDGYCNDFSNGLNCYDCKERYSIFYEIDDEDHYCKKYNNMEVYSQMRSVLYRGDFEEKKHEDCNGKPSHSTGGYIDEETLKKIRLATMDNANYLSEDKVKKLSKLIEKIIEDN